MSFAPIPCGLPLAVVSNALDAQDAERVKRVIDHLETHRALLGFEDAPARTLFGRTPADVLTALHDDLAREGAYAASSEAFSSRMRTGCMREENRMAVVLQDDDVARTLIRVYRAHCEEKPALAHVFVLLIASKDEKDIPLLARRFRSTMAYVSETSPPA